MMPVRPPPNPVQAAQPLQGGLAYSHAFRRLDNGHVEVRLDDVLRDTRERVAGLCPRNHLPVRPPLDPVQAAQSLQGGLAYPHLLGRLDDRHVKVRLDQTLCDHRGMWSGRRLGGRHETLTPARPHLKKTLSPPGSDNRCCCFFFKKKALAAAAASAAAPRSTTRRDDILLPSSHVRGDQRPICDDDIQRGPCSRRSRCAESVCTRFERRQTDLDFLRA